MNTNSMRTAFTKIELLVVVAILAILLCIAVPFVQQAREAGRLTWCNNHMMQIGLAMQNYASAHASAFPPSSTMTTSGTAASVTGWSFLVELLPYIEHAKIYKSLPLNAPQSVQDLIASGDKAAVDASNTSIETFLCPSNGNRKYLGSKNSAATDAFANYKAMSASTESSLVMCTSGGTAPPYGISSQNPDGAMYPGKFCRMADIADGTAHTILIAETQDDKYSRWIVGAECSLVGLNNSTKFVDGSANKYGPYVTTANYDGTFGDASQSALKDPPTFLTYDFSRGGRNCGQYQDPGWDTTILNTKMYGPSSPHTGIVVVGMADASAHLLSKLVDPENLFSLITRSGSDGLMVAW
jgi:prepilin-type N-terminal cleavage/methylation domain-containing protein